MSIDEQFKKAEYARSRKLFTTERAQGFNCSREEFATWWIETLEGQKAECFYCKTSIFLIRKLIEAKAIETRKTRGRGSRGKNLEIDCKIDRDGYSKANCVLACYYCNNDKSYIYDADTYEQFFGFARKAHFLQLAKEKSIAS